MNEGQKIELSGKTIGMGGERRMGGAIGMPRITRITGRTRKGVSPLRSHYPGAISLCVQLKVLVLEFLFFLYFLESYERLNPVTS